MIEGDAPSPSLTSVNWNFPFMIPDRDEESSMKASKFSEAQITFVLKQAEDGTAVATVCREAGINGEIRISPGSCPAAT